MPLAVGRAVVSVPDKSAFESIGLDVAEKILTMPYDQTDDDDELEALSEMENRLIEVLAVAPGGLALAVQKLTVLVGQMRVNCLHESDYLSERQYLKLAESALTDLLNATN